MPERGGPTIQSGVLYQNSVTALYLGRLCDAVPRPHNKRIVKVRVEAPENVDDTVVTYANGHRIFVQAKENIRKSHGAWNTLWEHFGEQFQSPDFRRGQDRLRLHIGDVQDENRALRELCERTVGCENYMEWWSRLAKAQRTR